MRSNYEIFHGIVQSAKLEAAVQLLTDEELRNLRGALARGEISSWSADLVHGVCLVEGCERFMNEGNEFADRGHGSEVPL